MAEARSDRRKLPNCCVPLLLLAALATNFYGALKADDLDASATSSQSISHVTRKSSTSGVPIIAGCGVLAYEITFAGFAGPEWSPRTVGNAPDGTPILGPFGGGTVVNFTLGNLPVSKYAVTVAGEVAVIGSWDGNAASPEGPDLWDLIIVGSGSPLEHTTFNNNSKGTQAFPNSYPLGKNLPGLGSSFFSEGIAIYPFQVTQDVPAGGTLRLKFSSSSLSADEKWGLKAFSIRIYPSSKPAILTQPQPPSRTLDEGTASTSFVVVGDGGTAGYQWQFNGTSIPGANSAILTLRNIKASDAGLYSVTISNCIGSTASASATLAVHSVITNAFPAISLIPDQIISEDSFLSAVAFTVTDRETPGNLLKVWADTSNPLLVPKANIQVDGTGSNRTLTLKPAPDEFGETMVTLVIADEGGLSATNSFHVKVDPVNDPPTLDPISPVAFNEDEVLTFDLTGISSGAENEPQTLFVTARSDKPAQIPDPVVKYSSPDRVATLTLWPVPDAYGDALVTVTVNDGQPTGASISRTFTATVNPLNDPPTLDKLEDLTIGQNAPMQAVPLSGITTGATNEIDNLTVLASSSNSNLIANLKVSYTPPSQSGTLSFSLVANATGVAQINVSVNDGQGANNSIVTRSFSVTLFATNSPPTISNIGPQTIDEDSTTAPSIFWISDSETPAADLILTARSSDPVLAPVENISFGGAGTNRTITVKPARDQFGVATITVSAKDEAGLTATRDFSVEVRPVNDPPTLDAIADRLFDEDAPSQSVGLTGIASGATNEVQKLTVTARSLNPSLVPHPVVIINSTNATGILTFAPVANANGSTTITVTVDDGEKLNNTFSRSFTVTVRPVNDPPTVSLSQPSDGTVFAALTNVTINAAASDPDGTIAKVEFFHETTKLGESTASPFSFAWSQVPAGNYTLTAKATDDLGLAATSGPIAISVREVTNNPPSVLITSPSDRSTYSPDVRLTITATASDVDGTVDRVEFHAGSTLLGTDSTSPYSFTWENVPVGDYSLTVKAIDNRGGETVSKPVIIAVSEIAIGEVAIVQDSPSPEIDKLEEYLFEMGLSSRVFDRGQLTSETLARFQLIIWNQADTPRQSVIAQEVEILHRALGSGVPLYFIGDGLAGDGSNLSQEQQLQWKELIHLSPSSGSQGNGAVAMNGAETFHPILRGRFGVVEDFAYPTTLEGAKESGAGAQVLALSDTTDVLVSFPPQDELDRGGIRTVTQNCRVFEGAVTESSRDARKRLFQNAVCWLLQCSSCGAIDLRLEAIEVSEPVRVGNPLVYFLKVAHSGECEGSGIVVTDTLPRGVRFVSAETSHGSWSEAGGIVTFKLGHVLNGSDTLMSITVIPTLAGTITNSARLRSYNNNEVSLENNVGSHVNVVEGSSLPIFEITRSVNDGLQLQVSGALNRRYAIEISTDLVNWRTWTNFVSADALVMRFVEPNIPKAGHRFYRLVGQ